jgi:hypothetical protein
MYRMKRTRWIPFALLLGVLLLPLPAMAGSIWEGTPAESWAGWWEGLLGWLGLDSSFIDPNGQPGPGPTWSTEASSSYIDPNGEPPTAPPGSEDPDSSSSIDPDGRP